MNELVQLPVGPALDIPATKTREKRNHGNRYSVALRIQCLTLISENYKAEDIERKLGVTRRTIYLIKKRAKERGYDPQTDPRIHERYVTDGPRSGRPKRSTEPAVAGLQAEPETEAEAEPEAEPEPGPEEIGNPN